MPQVGKEALSQFIRTECLRLLRLNLSPDAQAFRQERTAAGMPPVQPPRPGLEYLAQAGEEWQAEKIADLSDTFGTAVVIGDRYTNQAGQERFREIELVSHLTTAPQGSFLVESQFDVGPVFEGALGIAGYRLWIAVFPIAARSHRSAASHFEHRPVLHSGRRGAVAGCRRPSDQTHG